MLGGEKVPQGLRRKLRECASQLEAQDINVISTYGFTEAKMAWCECLFPVGAEPSGYHLYPDLGIVEVVDPETGALCEDGQPGEIVYTSLDARGSVVLRYRTGDIVEGGLTYEPCPYCGRTMPRLLGRISRRSDIREMQLDKVKGTLVDFNELEHVLDDMPRVGSWQIELRKANDDPMEVDELVLHVCLADGGEESSISKEIKRALFERAELHPNRIEFHSDAEMRELQGVGEKLKEQKVVDRRSKIETNKLLSTAKQMNTEPIAVIAGVRTPFAKLGTTLAGMGAADLARAAMLGVLVRTGVDPSRIDEVILGCVAQPADAPNLARVAALRSGIPNACSCSYRAKKLCFGNRGHHSSGASHSRRSGRFVPRRRG